MFHCDFFAPICSFLRGRSISIRISQTTWVHITLTMWLAKIAYPIFWWDFPIPIPCFPFLMHRYSQTPYLNFLPIPPPVERNGEDFPCPLATYHKFPMRVQPCSSKQLIGSERNGSLCITLRIYFLQRVLSHLHERCSNHHLPDLTGRTVQVISPERCCEQLLSLMTPTWVLAAFVLS